MRWSDGWSEATAKVLYCIALQLTTFHSSLRSSPFAHHRARTTANINVSESKSQTWRIDNLSSIDVTQLGNEMMQAAERFARDQPKQASDAARSQPPRTISSIVTPSSNEIKSILSVLIEKKRKDIEDGVTHGEGSPSPVSPDNPPDNDVKEVSMSSKKEAKIPIERIIKSRLRPIADATDKEFGKEDATTESGTTKSSNSSKSNKSTTALCPAKNRTRSASPKKTRRMPSPSKRKNDSPTKAMMVAKLSTLKKKFKRSASNGGEKAVKADTAAITETARDDETQSQSVSEAKNAVEKLRASMKRTPVTTEKAIVNIGAAKKAAKKIYSKIRSTTPNKIRSMTPNPKPTRFKHRHGFSDEINLLNLQNLKVKAKGFQTEARTKLTPSPPTHGKYLSTTTADIPSVRAYDDEGLKLQKLFYRKERIRDEIGIRSKSAPKRSAPKPRLTSSNTHSREAPRGLMGFEAMKEKLREEALGDLRKYRKIVKVNGSNKTIEWESYSGTSSSSSSSSSSSQSSSNDVNNSRSSSYSNSYSTSSSAVAARVKPKTISPSPSPRTPRSPHIQADTRKYPRTRPLTPMTEDEASESSSDPSIDSECARMTMSKRSARRLEDIKPQKSPTWDGPSTEHLATDMHTTVYTTEPAKWGWEREKEDIIMSTVKKAQAAKLARTMRERKKRLEELGGG